ncbi:MAG: AzlC family ABC transporter permease [Eubacteriales bacterium]|nr:AzlC family ABC transporter permease [Eubacteriales bacterium]
MDRKTIKYSFLSTLPVMAGYLVLGIGFGILLHDKGYSFWWAILMSVGIYAGSMQYVGVELLASHASPLSAALMTLMVNARHLFYGISMVEKYRDTKASKPYLIYALTDETYSLVCDPNLPRGGDKRRYYFWVSLMDQSYWVLGSFLGGLLGNVIRFNTEGIDFAMTALFVVIVTEQWEKTKMHIPAVAGAAVSIVCLLLLGPSDFLIPAMLGISVVLFLLKGIITKGDAFND